MSFTAEFLPADLPGRWCRVGEVTGVEQEAAERAAATELAMSRVAAVRVRDEKTNEVVYLDMNSKYTTASPLRSRET